MCLLHTHHADTDFNRDDIVDFYTKNSDGVGVMYAEDNKLHIRKVLPANGEQAWQFYLDNVSGKEAMVHWRMRTHGDTDLDNCHPYEVLGDGSKMPIYMMHNGILSHGNTADTSKSDTWHYINDFIKPCLANDPSLVFNPAFIALLEEAIGGSNKFGFMNHLGQTSLINESAFVEYKGCKLSNTYAWTSSKGGFGVASRGKGGRYISDGSYYGDSWGEGWTGNTYTPPASQWSKKKTPQGFFNHLRTMGFDEAYRDLTYAQATAASKEASELEWVQFLVDIEAGYLTDDDIIDVVKEKKVGEYVMGTYLPPAMLASLDSKIDAAWDKATAMTPNDLDEALEAAALQHSVAKEAANSIPDDADEGTSLDWYYSQLRQRTSAALVPILGGQFVE